MKGVLFTLAFVLLGTGMALSRTMVIAEQNELCRFACNKNYNDQVAICNREFGAGGP